MAGEGVLATLRAGWDALGSVDAAKAVIGGLALTAWKHARYTRDADVLVAIWLGGSSIAPTRRWFCVKIETRSSSRG